MVVFGLAAAEGSVGAAATAVRRQRIVDLALCCLLACLPSPEGLIYSGRRIGLSPQEALGQQVHRLCPWTAV
eukprot:CAMPEP_0178432160 /NCGR_PEP_ID=MMETSP0689_2-20121128/32238_1 /TAXON_ID=160604 /ORGANISM="Amphidinium massartii, Strain CS-259" /LENGTH=71 /DNA_ID=CAMNT_0020054131 /DNA_START=1 /DNA_END=213 /DNA_ORIENTATION=-